MPQTKLTSLSFDLLMGVKVIPSKRTKSQSLPDINAELQFAGKTINVSTIFDKAAQIAAGRHIDLYIKPEENMAYYVAENESGSFEIGE